MTRRKHDPYEYKIAYGIGVEELELEVNLLMKDGWLPIGSICINAYNTAFQGMIREREESNETPP